MGGPGEALERWLGNDGLGRGGPRCGCWCGLSWVSGSWATLVSGLYGVELGSGLSWVVRSWALVIWAWWGSGPSCSRGRDLYGRRFGSLSLCQLMVKKGV